MTLSLSHGRNPADATYSYVLLPGYSAAQVSEYAQHPRVEILANTKRIQAVRVSSLGLTAANFWSDGRASIGGITVDKMASVLFQKRGSLLEVAVSDPTQVNMGVISLELASDALKTISADPEITVEQLSPNVRLSYGVRTAGGRTFHALFETASN
jgi:hyaluronate lyase